MITVLPTKKLGYVIITAAVIDIAFCAGIYARLQAIMDVAIIKCKPFQ